MSLRAALIVGALGASACAPPATQDGGPEVEAADDAGVTTHPIVELYFVGTSQASGPDGTLFGPPGPFAAWRSVDEDHGVATELVVLLDRTGAGEENHVNFVITGSEFTMEDEEGLFEGAGHLEGDPWSPTASIYDVTFTDGSGSLHGVDTFSADSLTTEKTIADPTGNVVVIVRDTLAKATEAEFTTKRAELLGG